jgi:hypothetical protein
VFNPAYLTISRHRVYYFRWPLPRELHPRGRQSTIKVSLRTRDPKQAIIRQQNNVISLGSEYEAFAGANLGKGNETLGRLRQAQLTAFGLTYSSLELVENASASETSSLVAGDVVIACTAHEPHYVGRRVDIVDEMPAELVGKVVPVADVMVIRARVGKPNPPPTFLASFLRSRWGLRQFQRLNRGVRGGHVYGSDVESFVYLPRPESAWLKKFDQRQDRIRAARRLSIKLMQQAESTLTAWLAI